MLLSLAKTPSAMKSWRFPSLYDTVRSHVINATNLSYHGHYQPSYEGGNGRGDPGPAATTCHLEEGIAEAPRFLIHDRDSIFSDLVVGSARAMGIESKKTSFRSPWQNGVCERWILRVVTPRLTSVSKRDVRLTRGVGDGSSKSKFSQFYPLEHPVASNELAV